MANKYTMAAKVKQARKHSKLSQGALAAKTGLSKETIYMIESGRVTWPTLPTLRKISQGTKVKLSFFIKDIEWGDL